MSTSTSTTSLRILGLFAHPDDEVFVAGGTLAKYTAEGAEIMVISATRGQAGQIRVTASSDGLGMAEVPLTTGP